MRFTRKNEQGRKIPDTYYTLDYMYEIERGTIGWNINRKNNKGYYEYSFSSGTLKKAKESLLDNKACGAW